MAADLSPDILAALRDRAFQAPTSGSGWSPATMYGPIGDNIKFVAPDGNVYHTAYTSSGSVADGGVGYTVQGYYRDVVPGHFSPGDWQDVYGTDGRWQLRGQIQKESLLSAWLPFVIVAAAFVATAVGVAGAGVGTGTAIADAAPLGAGGAVADTAAVTTTVAGGAAGVVGTVATVAGTAGKILAVVSTVLGVTAGRANPAQPVAGMPVAGTPGAAPGAPGAGISSNEMLLIAAAAAGAYFLS